ncbi:MAG: DNA recombination protein RmuC [Synergistaceae bacterium]|nr:DNA recombination protein RmuC [Synergistaceae bacterium]
MTVFEILVTILIVAAIVLLAAVLAKKPQQENLKEDIALFRREQAENLDRFREEQSKNIDRLGRNIDDRLGALQKTNDEKLVEVNKTVGEKLQKNFAESFAAVTKKLEDVNKTVGEISGLTVDVKDLRKLFAGIKTRGAWGETQLRAIIEQLLARDQYEINVVTRPRASEPVEFAIKMPGCNDTPVLLPVDSKCPVEAYSRIVEASQRNDSAAVENERKTLRQTVLKEANDIKNKYIEIPYTTDFGILFVPIEGLFIEIMSINGLRDELLNKKIIPAGPTTFAALLNSLRLGFQTLQIQKKAGEIEILLGKVKTEFEKYGEIVEKSAGYIDKASSALETLSVRNRKITSALKNIEALPVETGDFGDGED